MPIYEFICPNCGAEKEIIQKYDDPLPKCEECDVEMERKIGRTTFILKGGGWAKDGYSKTKTETTKPIKK